MHIKSRELLNILPAIPEHEEHSIFIFIIVLMLLGILGYLFIQHVIPVISTVICDFLKNSYDAAGALSDTVRETGNGGKGTATSRGCAQDRGGDRPLPGTQET